MKQLLFSFVALVCIVACSETGSTLLPDSLNNDSVQVDTLSGDTIPVREIVKYDFSDFIPTHYKVRDSAVGDLNFDAFPDAIVVLQREDEKYGDERPRPVLILTGDSSGHFQLALRNDHLTFPKVDGQMFGEPFAGIEIDSGTFILRHYGGSRFRWTRDYVFEYDAFRQTWYYTKSYASVGDMAGEMNDLDSLGQCIPYGHDTLILKRKTDIRKFDSRTTEAAQCE